MEDILEFRDAQDGDIVIKPLDGCAGRGVLRIGPNDENASALLEMSTANGKTYVLAQRYIPEVQQGDKRIILVEGRPVGAVLRVPRNGELRANLHLGAIPHRTELTARDREICAVIGPSLREQGILFAGIDVRRNNCILYDNAEIIIYYIYDNAEIIVYYMITQK